MKRGLKVKSGVRAPAPIVFPIDITLVGIPSCPNGGGCGCYYCQQWATGEIVKLMCDVPESYQP